MNKILAVCNNPKCGNVFEARNIIGGTNIKVTMSGNTYGPCPKCGSSGKVLDATYQFDRNGLISILSAPEFTLDIISRLKEVALKAKENNYSKTQFREEFEKVSPVAKHLFDTPAFQRNWNMLNTGMITLFTFITMLVAILALMEQKKEKASGQPIINVYVSPPVSPRQIPAHLLQDPVRKKFQPLPKKKKRRK